MKKKHREIMKLFEPEKVPFKVKHGLKRFFRKSKFKPNRATKEGLGLLKYPKIKRTSRIAQVNLICLPILFMWDYGLFLIPIIIGASEMFDWGQDILKLPPCCRPLVRNNNGYWFFGVIDDDDRDPKLIESRDDGINWGSNHSDYNDNIAVRLNQETNGAASWQFLHDADYYSISLAVTDDNRMHIFAITNDVVGYNHLFTYSGDCTGNISNMTSHSYWRGYNDVIPSAADRIISAGEGIPHSGAMVAHGNLVSIVWSQKITSETNKYEIRYRHRNSVSLDADGGSWDFVRVTASSASDNYYPCLAVDSNGHFHVAWRNDNGDNSIKYAHAHTAFPANWYQSDDVSVITTGESGETILTEAGKDFDIPSLCINARPEKIDDIWVSGYLSDDDELYATQYDKSGGAWQAKAKFSATDLVDANGQLGVSADGKIHAQWSLKTVGGIRHSEYDVSWSAPETLQS